MPTEMKKVIILLIFVVVCSGIEAQAQKQLKDTTSKVELALGKMVNGYPVVVVKDKRQPMASSTFDSLTTLIATYKSGNSTIAIDSICYDVSLYKNTDIVKKSFCGFNFIKDYLKDILLGRESISFYVKVNRIVLKNGRVIINPNVENEVTIKSKETIIMQGVLFSVE